jgi:hypothetical protein
VELGIQLAKVVSDLQQKSVGCIELVEFVK